MTPFTGGPNGRKTVLNQTSTSFMNNRNQHRTSSVSYTGQDIDSFVLRRPNIMGDFVDNALDSLYHNVLLPSNQTQAHSHHTNSFQPQQSNIF